MWMRIARGFKNSVKTVRDYAVYYLAPLSANRRQIIRYGSIGLLIVFSTTALIAKLSGERYANEIQRTRTQIQSLQDQLRAFMQPDQIELGQQDLSVDYVIGQTDPTVFTPNPIDAPPRILITLHLLPDTDYPYGAFQRVKPLQGDMQRFVAYQHEVFTAIGAVLEYNTRAEFGDKTLSDAEIAQRIDNARIGLASAADNLRNSVGDTIHDPEKGKIFRSLSALTQAVESFSQSRNLEDLAKIFDVEQTAIIANRQAFWIEQTGDLYRRIADLNQDFALIEKSIRR